MPARRAKRVTLCRLVIITSAVPVDGAVRLDDVALSDVALVDTDVVDAGEPGHAMGEHGGKMRCRRSSTRTWLRAGRGQSRRRCGGAGAATRDRCPLDVEALLDWNVTGALRMDGH